MTRIGPFEPRTRVLSGVTIEMPALDLVAHWRRCGLSADFLAGYLAYDFANRTAAANVLSTAINEILENAAKFSADKRSPVRILVAQLGDHVLIEATNTAVAERADAFRVRLSQVLAEDPETLFARHLETASNAPPGSPGIGLVILRKDYRAQLAAEIAPREGGVYEITVQVSLPPDEVDPP